VSKEWHAYALHILDAIDRIRLIESRGSIVDYVVLYDASPRNLQTLSDPDDASLWHQPALTVRRQTLARLRRRAPSFGNLRALRKADAEVQENSAL
jgi:hypothetical protein